MDRLTRTVREQVALGRLLPLGGPDDTAWITERAAVRALRRAVAGLSGLRVGAMSLVLAGPGDAPASGAAPVGALPHVPVRIEAAFEAALAEPLPQVADRLREALWDAAHNGLGLVVAAVDLRITGLLGEEPGDADFFDPGDAADAGSAAETDEAVVQGTSEAVGAAVLAVPGVLRLTRRLAGLGAGVAVHDASPQADQAAQAERTRGGDAVRRVQVQIAVAPGHVPLTVARGVAAAALTAAAAGAPGPVRVAVVVTDAGT